MLTPVLLLIFGLALLIKCASWLVDGAVIAAEKLRVSPLLIGLTVVAFGTSAPELAVNVISALNPEASDVGLGNVVGSNIANIGLIVGIAALITPLAVKKIIVTREIPFMFLAAVAFLLMVADNYLGGGSENALSAGDGAVLLLFFAIFLYYISGTAMAQRSEALADEFEKEFAPKRGQTWTKAIGLIILGLLGVIFGGQLTVDNAMVIAREIGISEILIGLTIVAVGTSLPELVTSIVAAMKKEPDIAVGNIVGSNIFNIFFILGINAMISPVPFRTAWFVDVLVMIGFSALLFIVSLTNKSIKRWEGVLLLAAYVAYIIFIGYRG